MTLTILVSFLVFMAAGATRQADVISRLKKLRNPNASTPPAGGGPTLGNLVGWAVVYLVLITLSDIPPTGRLAAAFGWLMLVSTLSLFGPSALTNLSGVTGTLGGVTPKQASGTGATGATRVGGTGGT